VGIWRDFAMVYQLWGALVFVYSLSELWYGLVIWLRSKEIE